MRKLILCVGSGLALVVVAACAGASAPSGSRAPSAPGSTGSSASSGASASAGTSASSEASASGGGAGGVSAALSEFKVELDETTANAGSVTFHITNNGALTHEFVVIASDTPAASLPVGDDSTVSEDDVEVVDEVEDIEAGATADLTVDLPAGHYDIICNIEGHYTSGMHTDFTTQ